jgi:NagD protein
MTTPEPSLNRWLDLNKARIEAMLLDIDGVLLNGRRRLPGSRQFLKKLHRFHIPFVLLTNDGNHSTQEKAARLRSAGLDIAPEQIVSCGHAIAQTVQSMGITGARFFVMGDTGVPCYAESAALNVTRDLNRLQDCAGVIIGEENYDWEPVINAVVNFFIDHPQAPLIVPNPDEFYPGQRLKIHIAAGGVGRFIQQIAGSYGTSVTPIYLGKPYQPIFQLAQKALSHRLNRPIDPQNILMVGDNLAADIVGGTESGYTTALMLTGVTPLSKLDHQEKRPDMVFKAL